MRILLKVKKKVAYSLLRVKHVKKWGIKKW